MDFMRTRCLGRVGASWGRSTSHTLARGVRWRTKAASAQWPHLHARGVRTGGGDHAVIGRDTRCVERSKCEPRAKVVRSRVAR